MKYDHILVRFGEISTKGKNRKKFIEKLRQHIRFVLKDFEALKYASYRDRITIMLNGEDPEPISEQLKGVFGIQSFSLAVKCETNLDAIKEAALTAVQEVYEQGNTFKVSTKRSYKQFELDSNEMNREIGGHVLRNTENLTVNVKQPDVHLRIERVLSCIWWRNKTSHRPFYKNSRADS